MKKYLFYAAICIFMVSCSNDKIDDTGSENLSINSSETSLSFKSTGGAENLMITSNFVWMIISKPDWIEISPNGGTSGTTILTIEADKNTKTKSRTGIIILGNSSSSSFTISVSQDAPHKIWIYGEDPQQQPPFSPGAWDAAAMRFSDEEGEHFPTIPDDVYFGLKTLIFDVSDVSADFDLKVMNGWWSNTYYDHVKWESGLNELQITETMAKECAKGGDGHDLDLMLYSGTITIKSVYYEE